MTINRAQPDLRSIGSFSYASYGINHAPSTLIVPYVPVTGVPPTATALTTRALVAGTCAMDDSGLSLKRDRFLSSRG